MTKTIGVTYLEECQKGRDGMNIFVRSWRPEDSARGVVAIVHGFNSHSGYYQSVGEELATSGFAVYALDLRGRGKSDGERYFIRDIHEYTNDVTALVELAKSREPGLPVFVLGHSAGGVVSCIYTLEHQSEIAGLICESFAFQVYAPDFALAVLKGLSHIAPHAHVLRLPIKDFSRDPSVVGAMNNDPMVAHEVQPTSTVAAMVRADERLKQEFSLMKLPVLILHGSEDKVTKPQGSQFFFDNAGSADKTLKLYEGHYHDLLNDIGKDLVLGDLRGWLLARTARTTHA
ncbi:MAG: lysophospholipase [Bryobacteraceae bacterium]|nr:lysophospholipase [Bryobacteraceae bacterium]